MLLPTKSELIGIAGIIFTIAVITLFNLQIAERRSRDVQRRADVSAVTNALNAYYEDYGFFPPSTADGKIAACKGPNYLDVINELENGQFSTELYFSGFVGCSWGQDKFVDPETDVAYLPSLPQDSKKALGYSYYYTSNTRRFQIFAYLEGEAAEDGYSAEIVARGIACGTKVCNFGKAFGETPLNMSLEEYERKLEEERI